MDKTIKAAMLGAGFMGRTHAGNLAQIGAEVVAICAREGAEELARGLSGQKPAVYGDFDKMLRTAGIDVLYVCLPPFAHDGQVEAAAQKGIHLFLEKPIALNTQKARSMVEAIKKAGVVSQVGYHMRFGAAVQELKRMIRDGSAGIPTLFDGRYECNCLHSDWWRDVKKSGGQVFEQIIHLYDMSRYLMGEAESVSGYTANLCHHVEQGYTVEDTSASLIRFKSGALANISGSNCAVPMEWNNPFTVVCQYVTAYFIDPNRAEFVLTGNKEPVRRKVQGEDNMYLEETKAFIDAVLGKGPALCPVTEGLESLKLVESVVKSAAAGGRPVRI
ncbi:MAG: Gfo/Idh/MocA family protein [Bacillota bacterium]